MRMQAAALTATLATVLALSTAEARADGSAPGEATPWTFSALGYLNLPRGSPHYVTGILGANRGQLHLEARANYEARDAVSGFVGWTFDGGEALRYSATPIVGLVGGSANGPIVGLEASLAYRQFDYYVEVEYVPGSMGRDSAYTYAWSEVAYRPRDWLRFGLVVQRTRAYGGGELQRGGFIQFTQGKYTAGLYWFNPGSSEQIGMLSFGVTF